VTGADDFADHRASIETLLGLAANLSTVDEDRIRFAVRARHDAGGTADPRDASTGARLVAAMLAADAELTEDQVAGLEALIDSRLADV
jgi:hypothetical protein